MKRDTIMSKRLSCAVLLVWCAAVAAGCTKTEDKQYYASGKLESVAKVKKDADGEYVKDGAFVRYYEDGTKQHEMSYRMDVLDGPYVAYWENGQKQEVGQYKDNEPEGKWTLYYDNGNKMSEGEYKVGKKVPGTWKQWNEDGSEKKQEERGGRPAAPSTDG